MILLQKWVIIRNFASKETDIFLIHKVKSINNLNY